MESPEAVDDKEQFLRSRFTPRRCCRGCRSNGREGGGLYHERESLTRSKKDMPTHPSQKYTRGRGRKHG